MSDDADTFVAGYSKKDLLIADKLLRVRDRRVHFATQCHRNTRGEKMNFVRNPALPALYNNLARVLCIQGSVQSKKSEFTVIDHLAMAAEGLSVFFVVPKIELRNTYVQNRVDKRIDESPEYRKLLQSGSFNNAVIKSFGKGTVKYVGSNVISDFKEFPADAMVVEEVDECDQENIGYARDRLRGSIYQFRRYIGNPTIKDRGINGFFSKSCQNIWHVICRKCGQPVELDWFKTVVGRKFDKEGNAVDFWLLDDDWKPHCGRDINAMCPTCAVPIDRLGVGGLWIPRQPEAQIEGFLMTMMNSWENELTDMYESYKDAFTDEAKLQHFVNSNLGLTYTPDSSKLSEMLLQKCAFSGEPYAFVIKSDCAHVPDDCHNGPCSMGVDVGKVFHVRVSALDTNGNRKAVFIGKATSRQELIDIGLRYNVVVCVIDSMPEYRTVLDLQEEAPFFVWACRYGSEGKDARTRKDRKDRVVTGDRTILLDKSLTQIKAGRNRLPVNFKSILINKRGESDYVLEMTNPVRQEIEDKGGNTTFVWSKCQDHHRHADTYDMIAADMSETGSLNGVTVG